MPDSPTMADLYPDGRGYYQAHEAYIRAVADAFAASGIKVLDWYADPNDPRDGAIRVDLFGLDYDEVWVGWQEERRWHVLLIEEHEGREDSRWVRDLDVGTVFSPESVVRSFGAEMGVDVSPPADGRAAEATLRALGHPARPNDTAPAARLAARVASTYLITFGVVYALWQVGEALQVGQQYADPLIPCALIGSYGAWVCLAYEAIACRRRSRRVRG